MMSVLIPQQINFYVFPPDQISFIPSEDFEMICKKLGIPLKNIKTMLKINTELVKQIKDLEQKVEELKLSYFQLLKILIVVAFHIGYYIYT